MANDLAAPADLDGLPGAPFTNDEVDAAVSALRAECGWHIAPMSDDPVTIALDVPWRESWLNLPTLKLVTVDEVRTTSDDAVVDPNTYQVSMAQGGIRLLCGFWPYGFGTIEVDFTHGYESCPPDLLPVIASIATSQRLVAIRSPRMDQPGERVPDGVGGYAVTDPGRYVVPQVPILSGCALDNYSLRKQPFLA